MSRIRSQRTTGWPWSKPKSEEERLRERPSILRLQAEAKALRKKIDELYDIENHLSGKRRRESPVIEEDYREAQRRRRALETKWYRTLNEISEGEWMTPQEVYGPAPEVPSPSYHGMTSSSEGSTSDESSPEVPTVRDGMSSRQRAPQRKMMVRRNARTGRFVSAKSSSPNLSRARPPDW